MSRSYIVEGCQGHLDAKWDVCKTPDSFPGAELSFQLLLGEQLIDHIEKNDIKDPEKVKFKVKISGDGASISRKSNLFVCSFSIINQGVRMMSSAGNHTIAVVQTGEKYENLKASLSNIIKDINALQQQGYVVVNNQKLELEFFLGGDYKFLLLCLGMKQATSSNACIFCRVDKDERQDMSKPGDYFSSRNLIRTLNDNWHKEPGCLNSPLFQIPLDHCVIDELHLLLRITDRLEHALIYDAIDWDEEDNFGKPKIQHQQRHLNNVISAIHSCGVGFKVWRNIKDNKLDWTSLMGGDKKKLLKNLPSKFQGCVHPSRVHEVTQLWKEFGDIYKIITDLSPTTTDIDGLHNKAKLWAQQLMNMKGEGYNWTNPITPYIHILVYHLPHSMKTFGNVKKFTGQGVEKKNDDMRKAFHRSINRWDSFKSLNLIDKRLEVLQENKREKRKYTKKDVPYWDDGGKSDVVKKYPRISLPA